MPITLPPETTKQLLASIKRYCAEHLEEEVGDLKATMLLQYVLEEIGPSIYNRAIEDARGYFEARASELDGVCYEREFAYWAPKQERGRR